MAEKVWAQFILPRDAKGCIRQLRARLQLVDDCITLKYRGQEYKYFWDWNGSHIYFLNVPTNIDPYKQTSVTAKQLHSLVDDHLLAMFRRTFVGPVWTVRVWRKFLKYAYFWKRDDLQGHWSSGTMLDEVADYIEQQGVKEGDFYVITKQMLENIRKGGTNGK